MSSEKSAQPTKEKRLGPCKMSMFDFGVQAALEKSNGLAIYATMLDPRTAAVFSPVQIKEMVLNIFREQEEYLPGYK